MRFANFILITKVLMQFISEFYMDFTQYGLTRQRVFNAKISMEDPKFFSQSNTKIKMFLVFMESETMEKFQIKWQ